MMKLIFSIYSDFLSYKENQQFSKELEPAFINNESSEFNIELIPEHLILPILKNKVKDLSPSQYEEELSAFDGGVILMDGDKMINWQCCSDMKDIYEWEKIIKHRSKHWAKIWIGHPWIYYRIKKGLVKFSEYYEIKDDEEIDQFSIQMELPVEPFMDELKKLLTTVKQFKKKVAQAIENSDLENQEVMIDCLM